MLPMNKCSCGKKVAPISEINKCWDCDITAYNQATTSEICWKCQNPKESGSWLCITCTNELIAQGENQSEYEQDPCRQHETL